MLSRLFALLCCAGQYDSCFGYCSITQKQNILITDATVKSAHIQSAMIYFIHTRVYLFCK